MLKTSTHEYKAQPGQVGGMINPMFWSGQMIEWNTNDRSPKKILKVKVWTDKPTPGPLCYTRTKTKPRNAWVYKYYRVQPTPYPCNSGLLKQDTPTTFSIKGPGPSQYLLTQGSRLPGVEDGLSRVLKTFFQSRSYRLIPYRRVIINYPLGVAPARIWELL